MATGSSSPETGQSETESNVNLMYDADQDGVVEQADAAGMLLSALSEDGRLVLGDSTNGIELLVANEGGNVQIPNGSLSMGGQVIEAPDDKVLHIDGGGVGYNDIRISEEGGSWHFYDLVNGQSNVIIREGGRVEIPNGRLTNQQQDVATSPDGDYEIQKDGVDGAGVINFKTQ